MTTNLTIDDSSPDIIYSSNWAAQLKDDPNTELFFQSSYHGAQANGATANITFSGSAIYLYGSKGPGHANYSVQFDNFIIFYSASSSETTYQQPLFGFTFNTSGTHFVSLTSHFVPGGQWLDLDYITVTVNGTSGPSQSTAPTVPSASQSIFPPWLSSSSTEPSVSFPTSSETGRVSAPTPQSSSSSSTSHVALILSVAFGTFIAAALIIGALYYLCRGRQRQPPHTPTNAFEYKVAPSTVASQQSSPALVAPDMYTAQSPTTYHRTDPFAREPSRIPDFDARSRSPWSALSHGAATVITHQSTAQLLSPQSQFHTRSGSQPNLHSPSYVYAASHTHADSPTYSQTHIRSPSTQQMLQVHNTPLASPIDAHVQPAPASGFASGSGSHLPASDDRRHHHRHPINLSQSSLPTPTRGAGPPPKRPKRPGEGLLDWLGNSMVFERSPSQKRRRDDGNSERTDFLKV